MKKVSGMKRVEVRIPEYLYELLRKESYERDKSMTEIVTDMLNKKYLGGDYEVIKITKGV